jgi:uncharacterized RDD family membrane protein YckC
VSRTDPPPPLHAAPASLWRRLAAFAYDALLLGAVVFVFTWAVLVARGGREIAPGSVWFEASLVLLAVFFFCGFWTHGGQTLGMRAWRIRVVCADGSPLGWPRAAARFAAAIASVTPAGLGLWWSLLDPQHRCWHDRWAGTLVVRADLSAHAPTPSP